MENLAIPVLDPIPVGRLEWVNVNGTLYGVDAIGQTYVFKAAPVPVSSLAAARQLVADVLQLPTGRRAKPRYRRGRS